MRFTKHIKPVLQQIRLLTGLNVGGKMRNIAIQLVLQQCCKTSCAFFVARFFVPLVSQLVSYLNTLVERLLEQHGLSLASHFGLALPF